MNIIGNIPIYWINLNRSIERKQFMEKQFKKYNIKNTHRIEAIDGDKLNENNHNYYHSSGIRKLTKYEIACCMSHIKALHNAFNDNNQYAIIMEDDCDFEYLNYQKTQLIELFDIEQNIDLIQLVTTMSHNELINQKPCKSNKILQQGFKWNAGAYIVTQKGLYKLNYSQHNELTEADHFIFTNVNTYHVVKPYFRIGNKYDTLIHEKEKSLHDNFVIANTKYWDKYYSVRPIYL